MFLISKIDFGVIGWELEKPRRDFRVLHPSSHAWRTNEETLEGKAASTR
jgi:hypothetical protein